MAKKPQEKKPGAKPRLVESAGTEQEEEAPDTERTPQVGEKAEQASELAAIDAGWDQAAAAAEQAKEAKEKQELYAETVGSARSIDALKNVVDMIGTIETSNGTKMSAKDVKGWIDMAVQFPDSIAMNNITRNYGLREKVMELTKGARKEGRIEKMGQRVDSAMNREDSISTLDRLDKAAEKRDRIDAMGERVDAKMRSEDAEKAEQANELAAIDAGWDQIADQHAKDAAEAAVEEDFFKRGESVRGDTMPEGIGELGSQEYEAASAAAEQIPGLEQQLSRVEQALKERGISDIDEALAKRAIGGFAEKAKGFFGGLFSKKTREINSLMETYASVRDAHNAAKETLAKRRPMTEDQKALKRKQAESKLGR